MGGAKRFRALVPSIVAVAGGCSSVTGESALLGTDLDAGRIGLDAFTTTDDVRALGDADPALPERSSSAASVPVALVDAGTTIGPNFAIDSVFDAQTPRLSETELGTLPDPVDGAPPQVHTDAAQVPDASAAQVPDASAAQVPDASAAQVPDASAPQTPDGLGAESGAPVCGACPAPDNPCVQTSCDTILGECVNVARVSVACDDGNPCTFGDTCAAGRCEGRAADSCQAPAPLDLSSGSASLTLSTAACATSNAFDYADPVEEYGTCAGSGGPELNFELDFTALQGPVLLWASTVHSETNFDTVLAITAPVCADDAVLACNDDALEVITLQSDLKSVLEPGVYSLIVDGYHDDELGSGTFHLSVTATPCASSPEICEL